MRVRARGCWVCLFKWPRQKPVSGTAHALHPGLVVRCAAGIVHIFAAHRQQCVCGPGILWLSLPGRLWRPPRRPLALSRAISGSSAAVTLCAGVVLLMGGVSHFAPLHHGSNWRDAAREIRSLGIQPVLPRWFIPARSSKRNSRCGNPTMPFPAFFIATCLHIQWGARPIFCRLRPPAKQNNTRQLSPGASWLLRTDSCSTADN